MVFRSIFEPQSLPQITDSYSPMASSSTLKHHKPLHNFHLPPDLKWSVNHTNTNTHRFRKPAGCSQKLMHILSNSDSDVSPVGGGGGGSKTRAGYSLSPPNRKGEKLGFPVSDSPVPKKSKICIRIKTKQIKCLQEVDEGANAGDQHQNQNQDHGVEYDDADDSLAKTWNLRPRRGVGKGSGGNGGVPKIVAVVPEETNEAESDANKMGEKEEEKEEIEEEENQKKKKQKKKKKTKQPKLSIPLTKLEIEEDIYALTGSKPSRKPKKRSKHVQRQLDYLFPGMWLSSITPDMYRVNDAPTKD